MPTFLNYGSYAGSHAVLHWEHFVAVGWFVGMLLCDKLQEIGWRIAALHQAILVDRSNFDTGWVGVCDCRHLPAARKRSENFIDANEQSGGGTKSRINGMNHFPSFMSNFNQTWNCEGEGREDPPKGSEPSKTRRWTLEKRSPLALRQDLPPQVS